MISEKIYLDKVSLAHRKKFAQFFTPEEVAQIMVNWVIKNDKILTLLEPAFGLGIFSRLFLENDKKVNITGFEIDPTIYQLAKQNFQDFSNVNLLLEDYLFNDWNTKYDAVICNPPYFKFHDYQNIKALEEIKKKLKIDLSGFTNIYTLFLLKSIYQLNENGRIAYLVPSEFLNSDYGKYIKEYLLNSNTLRHIIVLDFKQNIFNDVSTTSALILLAKDKNNQKIGFSVVENIMQLYDVEKKINDYPNKIEKNTIDKEILDPNVKWTMYYKKQHSQEYKNLIPFSTVAKVVRGIATGANDYFVFNQEKAKKYSINDNFLLPCITKSKDVMSSFFTLEHFETLKNKNANIFLFNAKKEVKDKNVITYIEMGVQSEINKKHLTSKRNPWYLLENRPSAPIWVSVFNRNGIKFVRNEAGISNLTTFHCIYLVNDLFNNIEIDLLFAYLLTDVAKEIFNDNRREYGDGLKKFEPNDLNNGLMLDLSILEDETKTIILDLYRQYRQSVMNNNENIKYIQTINQVLKSLYKK